MGMWEKDKEMGRRLDVVFSFGDKLILWSASSAGTVETSIGTAHKTKLEVSPVENPGDRSEVYTLSRPIADRLALASDGDFPVIVELLSVPTNKGNPAVVLQYVSDYSADAAAQ